MTIFEALRISHDIQRELAQKLIATQGDSTERHALFSQLKQELAVHSVAEERHFYIPLMQQDAGVDLSRHAIAEHHQMDEMIEDLEETDPSSPSWLAQAKRSSTTSRKKTHFLPDGRQVASRPREAATGG
ncbi:hypothetical protein J2W71_000466 [Pseudomonas sp. 3400]|nr:hypothetical protein [Pseudomonas sp. 3400]MDR7010567.1 hypothetical protein [Pseudomonas alcaliphila]